jgi:hypothetical protein
VSQRALVEAIPEETLRLTPAAAHALAQRGELITTAPAGDLAP